MYIGDLSIGGVAFHSQDCTGETYGKLVLSIQARVPYIGPRGDIWKPL